jgi:hypothetical protein
MEVNKVFALSTYFYRCNVRNIATCGKISMRPIQRPIASVIFVFVAIADTLRLCTIDSTISFLTVIRVIRWDRSHICSSLLPRCFLLSFKRTRIFKCKNCCNKHHNHCRGLQVSIFLGILAHLKGLY